MSIDVFNDRDRVSSQGLGVYDAAAFRVSNGVNLGDPIADATELVLDDCYMLAPGAKRWRMAMNLAGGFDAIRVAEGSEVGRVGAPVHLDCCCTFMAPDGTTMDALVLVELEPVNPLIAAVYLLPMGEFRRRTEYSLVSIDTETPRDRLAELSCVAFARGTHIRLADGSERPVEDLAPGDRVATRDNGAQEIRWIGQRTQRANGAFAPIVILAGALDNRADLMLGPNQRIFISRGGADRKTMPEVVIKAELLVNGTTVVRAPGGFVEYYYLLLDGHEIVYAEGVATESLPIDTSTRPGLPRDVRDKLGLGPVRRRNGLGGAVQITERPLSSDLARMLRRPSQS